MGAGGGRTERSKERFRKRWGQRGGQREAKRDLERDGGWWREDREKQREK